MTDSSGGVAVGARVTIRDLERDVSFSTITNEDGNFSQQHLVAGRYQVRVELRAFAPRSKTTSASQRTPQARVDFKMQIGEVTPNCRGVRRSSAAEDGTSPMSPLFNQKSVNELPMMNRRFSNLQLITPGVMQTSGGPNSVESENPMGSYRLQVNGQMYSGGLSPARWNRQPRFGARLPGDQSDTRVRDGSEDHHQRLRR